MAVVPEKIVTKFSQTYSAPSKVKSYYFIKIDETALNAYDTRLIYSYQIPTKSDEYVVNRYIKHPIYKYYVYALLRNEIIEALCILRPIYINGTTVIRFVDYIGENNSFPKIAYYLNEIILQHNAEYIDIYSYGIPLKVLSQSGFMNRYDYDDLIVPDYFEPFERSNNNVSFAYKNINNENPIRLFKSDGDTDRPSMIPIS